MRHGPNLQGLLALQKGGLFFSSKETIRMDQVVPHGGKGSAYRSEA